SGNSHPAASELYRLLFQHPVTEALRDATRRGPDRISSQRPGDRAGKDVALVIGVERDVGESGLRNTEILGQHVQRGTQAPVGQQERRVLRERSVIEHEQELTALFDALD